MLSRCVVRRRGDELGVAFRVGSLKETQSLKIARSLVEGAGNISRPPGASPDGWTNRALAAGRGG